MGDIATYEARLEARIDIKGDEETEISNAYEFEIGDFIEKEKILRREIGQLEDNFEGIEIDDEYFEKSDLDNILKNYNLEDVNYVLIYKKRMKVNTCILEKVKSLNCKFEVIGCEAVIDLGSTWESIYCGSDNRTAQNINKTKLKKILNSDIPDKKLRIQIAGDGYGSNC